MLEMTYILVILVTISNGKIIKLSSLYFSQSFVCCVDVCVTLLIQAYKLYVDWLISNLAMMASIYQMATLLE